MKKVEFLKERLAIYGTRSSDYFESKKQTLNTKKCLFSRRSVLKPHLFIPPRDGVIKYESGWLDLSKQTVPLQGLKENLKLPHFWSSFIKTFPWSNWDRTSKRAFCFTRCLLHYWRLYYRQASTWISTGNILPNFSQNSNFMYLEIMMVEVGLSHGGFTTSEKIRWILQKARDAC